MLFTDTLMMFINIEQPQNAKLCNSHKQKLLNMQASDCPGANIVKMTEFAQSNTVTMVQGNAWDSKNNIALTQLLIKAGGEGNHECTHAMLQLLTEARKALQEVTHLNNQEKNKELSTNSVRWEDILDQAKELCQSMTIKGNTRWPPACNINDSQTPPKGCGVFLAQFKNNRIKTVSHPAATMDNTTNHSSRRKPPQEIISFEHIKPKMGHLKLACLAADATEPKDWTKVTLQHPQACSQRP